MEGGRVGLFRAPRLTGQALAVQQAQEIYNEPIDWYIHCKRVSGSFFLPGVDQPDTVLFQMTDNIEWRANYPSRLRLPAMAGTLLGALDVPQTFVSAHLALATRYGTDTKTAFIENTIKAGDHPSGRCLATVDGLQITFIPQYRIEPHGSVILYVSSVDIDPKQLPEIREQWHRRLDTTIWAWRFLFLVLATLVIPLIHVLSVAFVRVRESRRCSRNLCIACGYDLQGNLGGICPECGKPIGPRDAPA